MYTITEPYATYSGNLDTFNILGANESRRFERRGDASIWVEGIFEDSCKGSVVCKTARMNFDSSFQFYLNIGLIN